MAVNAGDIAFLGVNSDDPDQFAFIVKNAIAAGDSFVVTDGGYIADTGVASSTFRNSEGFLLYTAPAGGLAAGSVIVVATQTFAASRNGGGDAGTVSVLANGLGSNAQVLLSTSGDQLSAYTFSGGTYLTGAPTLVAFIDFGTGAYTGAGSTNASNIPTISGGQVLDLGNFDNAIVDAGDVGALTISDLSNAANFDQVEDPRYDFTTLGVAGVTVSISDAAIVEGDAGTSLLTFTVTRSANTGSFTVDVASFDGTATVADDDYEALAATTLTFTAGDVLSQQVSVTINGDITAEQTETFTVELSGLINTAGSATILDGSGTGTITNDDVVLTEIGTIQGAGHKSPFATTPLLVSGNPASGPPIAQPSNSGIDRFSVEGVVTARTTNGFWVQDADGDGDIRTSDGIFVFTGGAPAASITVGETVRVLNARVDEFRAGTTTGANGNLSVTQLNATVAGVSIQEFGGNTVIDSVELGVDRIIPTAVIDDDGFASFDVETDALDFWESLEGMQVTVPESIAVDGTNRFRARDPANSANAEGPPTEEIWVRIPSNTDTADLTPSGGLIIGAGDFNPERIQIDDLTSAVAFPDVNVGDTVGPVTGVVGYDFGSYEVLVSTAPTVTAGPIEREETTITRDARQVTIASYNVENLDPEVEDTAVGSVAGFDLYTRLGESDDDLNGGQYAKIAFDIAVALGAPTILGLQEIQDNDGAEISGVLAADVTLQTLVDLIEATYGIDYAFVEIAPSASNINGGQPNANIRNAFLYQADQVQLLDAFLLDPTNPAFAASRKPLVGEFRANGVDFTIVNNHFSSKGGDTPLFGNQQPPVLNSEPDRIAQAQVVNAYIDSLLAEDPAAKAIVLGDINDFTFSAPFAALTGTGPDEVLFDLAEALLPTNEGYDYIFEGNSQDLDHILVTGTLLDQADPAFDVVRRNAEFADQASDHDPLLVRLDLRAFGERLTGTTGADLIEGEAGGDRINGRRGDDTIAGGAGDDALKGGKGADVFVFAEGDGRDKVRDFEDGIDLIDLTAFAAIDDVADLDLSFGGGNTTIRVQENGVVDIVLTGFAGVLSNEDFLFA